MSFLFYYYCIKSKSINNRYNFTFRYCNKVTDEKLSYFFFSEMELCFLWPKLNWQPWVQTLKNSTKLITKRENQTKSNFSTLWFAIFQMFEPKNLFWTRLGTYSSHVFTNPEFSACYCFLSLKILAFFWVILIFKWKSI